MVRRNLLLRCMCSYFVPSSVRPENSTPVIKSAASNPLLHEKHIVRIETNFVRQSSGKEASVIFEFLLLLSTSVFYLGNLQA